MMCLPGPLPLHVPSSPPLPPLLVRGLVLVLVLVLVRGLVLVLVLVLIPLIAAGREARTSLLPTLNTGVIPSPAPR